MPPCLEITTMIAFRTSYYERVNTEKVKHSNTHQSFSSKYGQGVSG